MEEKLRLIFLKRTNVDFMQRKDLRNVSLFGSAINLPERELVYILLDIQKEFNITIPKDYILHNKFSTYNCIENIVREELTN